LAQYVLHLEGPLSLENSYAHVLLAFLRADIPALSSLAEQKEQFMEHAQYSPYESACCLRLAIRKRAFDSALSQKTEAEFEHGEWSSSEWRGEIALLLATHFTIQPDFQKAKEWFRRAYKVLLNAGCPKKALRARLNELVAESHLDPVKNQISDYHDLYRWSTRQSQREDAVAITCLVNISREYQRAGAYLAGLQWCEKGLRFGELQFGSVAHHLLLAQKADLLVNLNRRAEAAMICDELKLSPFPEVKAALEVLLPVLGDKKPTLPSPGVLPTWRERLEGNDSASPLSKLEDQLVEYLSSGPRDRVDLINHLYGSQLSYETKLNRLKSLLSTLRKKNSELVRYRDGLYELADQIAVPRLRRAND
jgi:hypothetical protein